jgi:tetratricopeptide (TPR) repeat protein
LLKMEKDDIIVFIYYTLYNSPFDRGWVVRRVSLLCLCVMCCIVCITSAAGGQSLFDQGMKEFQQENYEEALQYFLDAGTADAESSRIAYHLGLTYKMIENYIAAIPYLRKAVTLSPRVDEALVALIDVLYNTDGLKEASEWIAVAEKDQVSPAQVQYLKGLVLAKEGKPEPAITAFGKSKEFDPSLGQQAEFQIANAYAQQGKLSDARDRLRSVMIMDPGSDMALFARDYEKIVADRIERERPWRFSVGFTYKYDTNVIAKGNGPLTDSITGQEDSALSFSIRARYRAPFSFRTPFSFSGYYSLSADRYLGKTYTRSDGSQGSLTEYNNMTNQFTLVPGYTFGRFAVSLPLSYSYISLQGRKGLSFFSDIQWITQTRYMESTAVTPTLRFITTENSFGEVFFSYIRKKYFETELHPEPFLPEEERSGERLVGGTSWTYLFKETKGIFTARYSFAKDNVAGRNWTNRENRFGADILYPLVGSLKAQAMAEAIFVGYSHTNSFFNEKRSDEIYNLSLGLIYGIFKNADIILQYNHFRNTSNIPFYNYRRNVYTLGMEYRF